MCQGASHLLASLKGNCFLSEPAYEAAADLPLGAARSVLPWSPFLPCTDFPAGCIFRKIVCSWLCDEPRREGPLNKRRLVRCSLSLEQASNAHTKCQFFGQAHLAHSAGQSAREPPSQPQHPPLKPHFVPAANALCILVCAQPSLAAW